MKFDDKFIERKNQLFFLFASLGISIVSSFIPEWVGNSFSTADQIIFGTVVFAIFVLFDVLLVLAIETAHQTKSHELWRLRTKGDHQLTNIRTALFQIVSKSYGSKDLFVEHFEKELASLEQRIRDAADKDELRVEQDHFLSVESVLASLHGDDEQIYRFTWEIDNNEELFKDINLRLYFEVANRMLRLKSMKEVRVIIIVDDLALIQTARVAKLLDFIQATDGFDCRIVRGGDYAKLCEGNGISSDYNEVGIFGNRLLFLTEQFEPTAGTIGIFTKDNNRITRYKSLFNTVWSAISVANLNPSKATTRISLEELFTFDREHKIQC